MPKTILWLDFETTGLHPADDILEVAAILTDNDLIELGRFHRVIRPEALDILQLDPIVSEMHTKNGLIGEVVALDLCYENTLRGVGGDLAAWLRNKHGLGRGDVRLAGAGVSHFDHDLIKRNLRQVAGLFHYATIDVSVIRRFIEDVVGDTSLLPTLPDGNHRAMTDVENALAEAMHYRSLLDTIARSVKA